MRVKKVLLFATLSAVVATAGCSPEQGKTQVSFKQDIHPMLTKHCGECHQQGGQGSEKTGFQVDSHASLMQGTKFGPVVVAGSAVSSTLWRLVAGKVDPSIQMPHGREPLKADEVALLETWIDQGAKDN